MASYTSNLRLPLHFRHEHVSTSLGVAIQGKTSPILSGMVAPLSSLLFLSFCSSLCVPKVLVAPILGSYIPNIPLSFHFPHDHASSSLGVVIQGKTSPILSGKFALSSSLLFLSLRSTLSVSVVCVAVIMGSYTPNLPLSCMNMFPHRWGLLHRERHLQFFLGCFPLRLHYFCYLYAILCVCQWFVWLSF